MGAFQMNPDFIPMLARSAQMKAVLQQVADEAAARAREIADREARRTGAYSDGIIGAVVGTAKGELVGQIQATDYKSRWIELGTVHQPPKAIVRRAGETIGPVKTGEGS